MKKIIVKEIDRLKSLTFKDKIYSEYIIYIISEMDVVLDATIVVGTREKNHRLDTLVAEINDNFEDVNIEEISLEENIKQEQTWINKTL